MFTNISILESMMEEKTREFAKEAKQHRLIKEALQTKPNTNRFLAMLGEEMILIGTQLQQQYGEGCLQVKPMIGEKART
jgi:hypothetical protein